MKKIIAVFIFTLGLNACSTESPELKSPCVGIEGSPCDKRSPSSQYFV